MQKLGSQPSPHCQVASCLDMQGSQLHAHGDSWQCMAGCGVLVTCLTRSYSSSAAPGSTTASTCRTCTSWHAPQQTTRCASWMEMIRAAISQQHHSNAKQYAGQGCNMQVSMHTRRLVHAVYCLLRSLHFECCMRTTYAQHICPMTLQPATIMHLPGKHHDGSFQ